MIKIIDAILAINSNAEVVVRGSNLDDCQIEWQNNTAEISKADIKVKKISVSIVLIILSYPDIQIRRTTRISRPYIYLQQRWNRAHVHR